MGILDEIIKPEDCILALGIPASRNEFMEDVEAENKDFAKIVEAEVGWPKYENNIICVLQKIVPILRDLGITVIHRFTLKDFGDLFKENKAKIIILFNHWKEESHSVCFERQDYLEFLHNHSSFLEYAVHRPELLEWLLENSIKLKSLAKARLEKQKKYKNMPLIGIKDDKIHAGYDGIVRRHLSEIDKEIYIELLKHSFTSKVEFYDGLKSLYDIICQIPADFHDMLDLNVCRCKDLAIALKKTRPNCYFKYKFDMFETGEGDKVDLLTMLHLYKILFQHLNRSQLTYFKAFREVARGFSKLLFGHDDVKRFLEE
jgi:hypothetical protein